MTDMEGVSHLLIKAAFESNWLASKGLSKKGKTEAADFYKSLGNVQVGLHIDDLLGGVEGSVPQACIVLESPLVQGVNSTIGHFVQVNLLVAGSKEYLQGCINQTVSNPDAIEREFQVIDRGRFDYWLMNSQGHWHLLFPHR